MNGWMRGALMVLTVAALPAAVSGCRVAETDVRRWETTQRGPFKLVAVITHDKYSWELRTEAALSLIRMPPRGGTRQGIKFLVEKYKDEEQFERDGALVQLSDDARQTLVDRMTPELVKNLQAPPPARVEGRLPPDPTVPYKDAAFALLIHDSPSLVRNEETKKQLRDALTHWAQTGFEDRIENGSQQYGLEQMMRYLGAASVKLLPAAINENTARIDRISSLVKDIGDDATKLEVSKQLVVLAEKYNSKEWLDGQLKVVKEHNAKNNPGATEAQATGQVDKIQERRLTEEVFPSMKRIGGRPSIDYLLKYAGDASRPAERRKLALAALEGNLDRNNPSDLDRIFSIARSDEAPDPVRDGAFRRLGEFPKEQFVSKLYTLVDYPKKWKIRWVAGEIILKTMTPSQVHTFMAHLPKTAATKMGMTEPLSYGGAIAKMEPGPGEPKPRDVIQPYLNSRDLGPKLTALGFFWEGKKADRGAVQPYAEDNSALPKCEKEDECSWSCDVPKAPGSKETEPRELKTVGDFVKLCLLPSMEK